MWNNFTLGDPGDAYERYAVWVDAPEGLWLNVSVYVEDVDDWTAYVYYNVSGATNRLESDDAFDDTFVGDTGSAGYFEVGTFGEGMLFIFDVQRDLGGEGSFDILFDPYTTYSYVYPPQVLYPGAGIASGDWLAASGGVIAGVGITVAAVIVVVYVLKRTGKI